MVETEVREHRSQHDDILDLPLVSDSARVTDVERMDMDRRPEVTAAIKGWISDHDLTDAYGPIEGPADWTGLPDRLVTDGYPVVARQIATLAERYDRPKPMLVRARFATDEPFDFVAGQYVGLRYRGTPRAYSIANSPTEEGIEICVRRVPGGKLSPQLCDSLTVGEEVTLRGPYGELVLGDHSARDVVFLATGTGVAPLKSMIDYLFDTGRDVYDGTERDVWLFLGAAWRDDVPYRAAFRALHDRQENFHFVPCLSREPVLTDWEGEAEYVQHALLKHTDRSVVPASLGQPLERRLDSRPRSGVEARIDPTDIDVYACGINAMVYSLVRTAEQMGVPPERIESEGFG